MTRQTLSTGYDVLLSKADIDGSCYCADRSFGLAKGEIFGF